jgi:hypothetical protein
MSDILIPAGLLVYGFLLSFVLSASARNRRERRANPAIMVAVGLVLAGISVTFAVGLPIWAWLDPAGASAAVSPS